MTSQALTPRTTAALLLGLVLLAGCGREENTPPPPSAMAPPAAVATDPLELAIDEDLKRRVIIDRPPTRRVADTIGIAGRLEANQNRSSRIGAPITGRLTMIDAQIGQLVRPGQTLAEINSPELAQAQLNFLRAHSQTQLLTRAVERAKLLLDADVIGAAELQRRQGELVVAQAEKRAAHDQLRALGLSEERLTLLEGTGQIQPTAEISATLGGTVIER